MTRLAQVKAERDAALQRVSMLETGIHVVLTATRDQTEYVRFDGDPCEYAITLYGAVRADGGYVVIVMSCPDQRDTVRLERFDTWEAQQTVGTEQSTAFRIAADRLRMYRQQLIDASWEFISG